MYNKAQHIVQMEDMDHHELIYNEDRRAWLDADRAENVPFFDRLPHHRAAINSKPTPMDAMLMEYVPNGDMSILIKRAATMDLEIPNRVLLKLFLCSKSQSYPGVESRDEMLMRRMK